MKKLAKLVELTFPEYRERHIFTTKLRLAIFIGFWILYLYFLKDVLSQTKTVTIVICISFVLTSLAYYNVVIRSKPLLLSFMMEIFSDLVTITCVVYLTGGPYSTYYTVYIFYCFAAGVFYNHYLSALIAIFSLIFYSGFLLLCNWGVIPPLILNYGDRLPIPAYTPIANFFFAAAFLALTIYAVKISSFFSQKRERMLEQRNKELVALHEKLSEANRVKSEFLAIMSHELRTPLTAIIGFSELMLEGVVGELTKEQRESVQEVLNNGADLLDLINSLLDLSKIDSGKMRFEAHAFDIPEMTERISGMISSLIKRKEQNFSIFVQPDLPPLFADERKIQQVILNLLSNAIKFTPNGGKISVGIRYYGSWDKIDSLVYVSRLSDRKQLYENGIFEITVGDTGVGIKEEHLEMVFDVFQQADSSITRSYGGTGLGLALARQYVDQHKGVIWAESEYGKGAKFYVILPVTRE